MTKIKTRKAATKVATIDFHVTSECSQSCCYCWGPRGYENPVDTESALRAAARLAVR